MKLHKLRNRIAGAVAIGIGASAVALMIGGGVATASPPTDPSGGAIPVYPHFYNGNVEGIRSSGSDTTFFMMQRIGDLFTSGGLYGCTLDGAVGQLDYNSTDPTVAASNFEDFCQKNANVDTTDVNDNWDRTEVSEGVDDVGSGAGQQQLCGDAKLNTPASLPVDFARSSKPVSTTCATGTEIGLGYAKDGVPIVDFPTINPSTYGTSTFNAGSGKVSYASVNGGNIGAVAKGWEPGDALNGSGSQGYSLTNLSDIDASPSTVYKIWCSGAVGDWGQLTNLGGSQSGHLLSIVGVTVANTGTGGDAVLTLPASATVAFPVTTFPSNIGTGTASGVDLASGTTVTSGAGTNTIDLSAPATTTGGPTTVLFTTTSKLAVGSGVPIGLPIRVMGVNTASGTEATFQGYANFGVSGTSLCASQAPALSIEESDPNAATATGDNSTPHQALENNASQISDFDAADFPITGSGDTNDAANQAIELATTLYYESNGVFNTNPHSGQSPITYNGVTTEYAASELQENGQTPTAPNLLDNDYPTSRTLFNIYNTATVRASTAGFLNWICDSNTLFQKGTDQTTGSNFDSELGTIIGGNYGFVRLTDQSVETSGSPDTGFSAPNGSCGIEATGNLEGTTITIPDTQWPGGTLPAQLVDGIDVAGPDIDYAGGPTTGDVQATIQSISDSGGVTTITITNQADQTIDNTSELLTFGLPPILSVALPQT